MITLCKRGIRRASKIDTERKAISDGQKWKEDQEYKQEYDRNG